MPWDHARRRSREGAAAVEFAIILPLFMVLLLGLIDFGHMFFVLNTMNGAARQAARSAAVEATAAMATATALAAADQYLTPAGLGAGCAFNCPVTQVQALAPPNNDTIRVVISIPGQFRNITGFTYALPGFNSPFAAMVGLSATSDMRWELAP